MYIYIHIYIQTHTYKYIYIYMYENNVPLGYPHEGFVATWAHDVLNY